MELDQIEFADTDEHVYDLNSFTDKFRLPQIVRVQDGYFDFNEETTLSSEEILTLHYLKSSQMLNAESGAGAVITIPIELGVHVDLLRGEPKVYFNAASLHSLSKDDLPLHVVTVKDHPILGIKANEVLRLESRAGEKDDNYLSCYLTKKKQTKKPKHIKIPLSFNGAFQAVIDNKATRLLDVARFCQLPYVIQVLSDRDTSRKFKESMQWDRLDKLGKITITKMFTQKSIIATIRHLDRVSVMQIPADLEITVSPARGALETERGRDRQYEEVCQRLHKSTQLEQLNQHELDRVRTADEPAAVENIYEYIDESGYCRLKDARTRNEKSEYADLKPTDARLPVVGHSVDDAQLRPPGTQSDYYKLKPTVGTITIGEIPESSVGTSDNRHRNTDYTKLSSESKSHSEESELMSAGPPITFGKPSTEPECNKDIGEESAKSHANPPLPPKPSKIRGKSLSSSHIDEEGTAPSGAIPDNLTDEEGTRTASSGAIPDNLEGLSVEEVVNCLRLLHMDKYVERFREEQIDGSMLTELTPEILDESLGMNNKLHQVKLMKLIQGWRPK